MNLDTITLKFQSVVSKMKSDLSDTINKYQKLDSSIEKVSNSMNKMTNTASNIGNSFKNSTQQIEELEKELKDLTSTYSTYSKVWKEQRLAGSKQAVYNPTEGTAKFDPNAIVVVTQEKLDEQKARIDEIQGKLLELKGVAEQPVNTPSLVSRELVPNTGNAKQNLEQIGKNAQESTEKVNRLSTAMGNLSSIAKSVGSKGFDFLRNKFSNFTKGFGKGIDGNIKQKV